MTDGEKKSGWVHEAEMPAPSLEDNTAFVERLCRQLSGRVNNRDISADLSVIRALPKIINSGTEKVRCTLFGSEAGTALIDARPIQAPAPLGLAVDLGTTRVVLRILDLEAGQALAEESFDNPQVQAGPDVLARIHYAETAEGADHLRSLISNAIDSRAAQLAEAAGLASKDILCVAVAGNTAMTHLFLGADPFWMIREPYTPMVNKPGFFRCSELGLNFAPSARAFVFPNVGSYFGGDLISGILNSGMNEAEDVSMLVDVGTNAEVVIGNRDWLMACAGAAGPALEGGVAAMGMTAGPGAIEKVRIDPETREFSFSTIEEKPPVGICGSGVIDLAAQLFLAKIIDLRGKLIQEACGDRFRKAEGLSAIAVVPAPESATGRDLLFTQADLDSLIRSKAAMYSILRTITNTVGMGFEDLSRFNIAGTFGSYIDPVSAITIGMIPDLPLSTYQALGNTSLEGAAQFLMDNDAGPKVAEIRRKITYMELNVNQEFMNRFSAAKFIPHTDPSRFPSVKV